MLEFLYTYVHSDRNTFTLLPAAARLIYLFLLFTCLRNIRDTRSRFLVHLSCKSGTGFFWHQILASIRTRLNSKPESGVHVIAVTTFNFFSSINNAIIVKAAAVSSINIVCHVCAYFRRQKFSFHVHKERKTGTKFMATVSWGRFLARVSWALAGYKLMQ